MFFYYMTTVQSPVSVSRAQTALNSGNRCSVAACAGASNSMSNCVDELRTFLPTQMFGSLPIFPHAPCLDLYVHKSRASWK